MAASAAGMRGIGAIAVAALAVWAGFDPARGGWAFVLALGAFEVWVALRLRSLGTAPAEAGVPPYRFTPDEARLVGRYRFHFRSPAPALECAVALGAAGAASLLLAPWLTFRGLFAPAAAIGLNLFAVARLTREVAPGRVLRARAERGDRAALETLALHDSAWEKIRAANALPADGAGKGTDT